MKIIIDTREQQPWWFRREVDRGDCQICQGCLTTGDYSVDEMRELVAIERKSISDLWSCVGGGRDRFRNQFERLAEIRWSCLIVEGSLTEVARYESPSGNTRKLQASHVIGTITSWSLRHSVPVWYGGTIRESERLGFLWLRAAWREWISETAPPPETEIAPTTNASL